MNAKISVLVISIEAIIYYYMICMTEPLKEMKIMRNWYDYGVNKKHVLLSLETLRLI